MGTSTESRPSAVVPELLVEDLPTLLAPLPRVIRRAVRRDFAVSPLPDAQVDVLRTVLLSPGLGVAEVADQLQVAPNTVSTLVRSLTAAGLLQRTRDLNDRRVVRLHLTDEAQRLVAAWTEHRSTVLREVLGGFSDEDRAALAAAVPALRQLLDRLDAYARGGDETTPGPDHG